jgi:hypothetical protein
MSESEYYKHQEKISGLTSRISTFARNKMMNSFMEKFAPGADLSVLDVGVTCDTRSDSNFFEKQYPFKSQITAIGLEDASFLEQEFPGLRYIRADGLALPFSDNEFDIAVSWAVIEHVGGFEKQEKFLKEIIRVSKRSFITTPNRWYPIEFHTVIPFLHWLPPHIFRDILKMLGMNFYATEETLNLLDENALVKMLPPNVKYTTAHFRLLGPISHLIFCTENS